MSKRIALVSAGVRDSTGKHWNEVFRWAMETASIDEAKVIAESFGLKIVSIYSIKWA